jgi:hypothetical protein
MHPLVQAAIDAANAGQTAQAKQYLKQVLTENSNDVDGWLVLAAVIEDPARQRQCLQRVLTLDPANEIAREELLEMDRAAMGGAPLSQASAPTPVTANAPQPASRQTEVSRPARSAAQPQQAPQPKPAAAPGVKTVSFRYPLWMRIFLYAMTGIVLVVTLANMADPALLGGGFLFFLLSIVGAWMVSVRIEVSSAGLRVAQIFAGGQMAWNEIARLESNTLKRRLTLHNKTGQKLNITTQVSGYPQIIEILRQKRPDLFGLAAPASSQMNSAYAGMGQTSAPAFAGTRVFKKSFMKRFGSIILGVVAVPIGLSALLGGSTESLVGGGIMMLIAIYFIVAPFFTSHQLKLEPGLLTIASTFDEEQLRPSQVANITMQTARSRRGSATNFVVVRTSEGKNISLQGFEGGDEILYGTLMNWWKNSRSS